MEIDNLKISREINFNGMPCWVSVGGTTTPDEDPIENLKKLQKVISEYQDEEQKAYTQSKWGGKPETKPSDEVQALIDGINACTYIQDGDTGEFNLSTFWLRAKGNLSVSTAYKAKEKQLTDAK